MESKEIISKEEFDSKREAVRRRQLEFLYSYSRSMDLEKSISQANITAHEMEAWNRDKAFTDLREKMLSWRFDAMLLTENYIKAKVFRYLEGVEEPTRDKSNVLRIGAALFGMDKRKNTDPIVEIENFNFTAQPRQEKKIIIDAENIS